ncbi:diguanylate cyclase [Clostridium sp.]|uniref:sensor domain-containing diguanylate cyclase n=1 Tax=Clostridium sp. TaxID=1506 RepID=UPI0026189453|nr:diguanylate cyclase [Clostridium sp.]
MIILTSIYISNYNTKNLEMVKQNLVTLVNDQSIYLESFFDQNISELNIDSGIPAIRDLLNDSNHGRVSEDSKESTKVLGEIFDSRKNQQFFLNVELLIDKSGAIIASCDKEYINKKAALSDEETQKLVCGEVVVTDIIQKGDVNKGIKSVIVASPIFFDNEYQGAIVSIINMNYFEKLVNEVHSFKTGEIMVLDNNGMVAASSSEYVKDSISKINVPNNLYEEWKNIDLNKNPSGTIEYKINGVEKVGYYSRISNSGWVVFSGVEWNELKTPINKSIKDIVIFLVLIVLLIVSSYVFTINYFSKPIYKLLQAIRKIKQGDYKDRFIYNENNEFGEIAGAFNDLIDNIEKNNKYQEELRISEERYGIIISQTEDIIFEWNINKDTIYFSENWKKKFGYEPITSSISENISKSNSIHKDDIKQLGKVLNDIIKGETYAEAEIRIRKEKIEYIWCKIRITAMFDKNGNIFKAIGIIIDIDKEKKKTEELLYKAQRDSLTSLYNKGTSQSMIEEFIKDNNSSGALFVIDLDNFKAVNDNLGHLAGDVVLTNISSMISKNFYDDSIVGRIGGDEFIIFLKNVESEEQIRDSAEELLNVFRRNTAKEILDYNISASIGIAKYPEHGETYKELFISADKAVYLAKNRGKDNYCIFKNL